MKFEDLLIEKSQTIESKAQLLEQRLIAIRQQNRGELLNKMEFQNHKMEQVTVFRGVYFINDAKAENINATYYCLDQMKSSVVWLVEGKKQNVNYQELIHFVSQKVKAIVCIGEDNDNIKKTFKGHTKVILECKDMDTAVRQGFYIAQKGEIVLLSSGCPCGEIYKNYMERGNAFKQAVAQL